MAEWYGQELSFLYNNNHFRKFHAWISSRAIVLNQRHFKYCSTTTHTHFGVCDLIAIFHLFGNFRILITFAFSVCWWCRHKMYKWPRKFYRNYWKIDINWKSHFEDYWYKKKKFVAILWRCANETSECIKCILLIEQFNLRHCCIKLVRFFGLICN